MTAQIVASKYAHANDIFNMYCREIQMYSPQVMQSMKNG